MLISQKHRFIFIHVYKNAGSSITRALRPLIASNWRWKIVDTCKKLGIDFLDPCPYAPHIRASELIQQIGKDVFNSYFSFAIVRNPWDWQVSLYKFMLKAKGHPQHELINNFKNFDEYIRWRCQEEVRFQKDFIYSSDGELLLDFVGRFENIDEDFKTICNRIAIPSVNLPKINVSNTRSYQEYYNKATIELVRKTFEPDISLFNYSFEPPDKISKK